jgi:hypothetical protein
VNCSTEAPCEFVALQPVQLVSIELAPGEMEKVALEGLAATPPPQPARKYSSGELRHWSQHLSGLTGNASWTFLGAVIGSW